MSAKPNCYIVGSMGIEKEKFCPRQGDYIIAADGGYEHLHRLGYKPDLLVGDFDSIKKVPKGVNIVRLPKEKNDTDTLYAIKLGMEKGHTSFIIHGGMGGRADHTLANIQSLAYIAERGATGYLIGEGTVITALKDGKISFSAENKGIISVFCNGSVAFGVNIRGLKYPLTDATLTSDMPIGVSNEFIGSEGEVSVEKGTLIIMWSE
jgi:thiamine pyrophosphokinase